MNYRLVVEPRVRYPDKPVLRARIPTGGVDPDSLLVRLRPERELMARRVLKEGARGWRRWSTLRRHSGRDFSPFAVEQVLDELVRFAGLHVDDRFRNGDWLPERFRVDESMWPWLEIVDPRQLVADLERDLSHPALLEALKQGRPPGMDWRGFDFCLRSAERLLDLREHGVRPSARELAGLIDHTKAWTDRRRAYVSQLLGEPFSHLVATADRQLQLRGPLRHPEGGLWASAARRPCKPRTSKPADHAVSGLRSPTGRAPRQETCSFSFTLPTRSSTPALSCRPECSMRRA